MSLNLNFMLDRVCGRTILVLGLFLCAALVGCSAQSDRPIRVSGDVTFNGQPVPFGSIIFDPDIQAGNNGPQGSAQIKDGHFDTKEGLGLTGGAYVARITGFPSQPDVTNESNAVQPLFPEFKEKVEFKASTSTQKFAIQ